MPGKRQALLPRRLCAQARSRDLKRAVQEGSVLGRGRSCVGGGEDFSRTIGSRGMGVAVAFRSRSNSSSLVCLVCENPREVEEKSRNLTTSERDEEGKGVWVVRGYL